MSPRLHAMFKVIQRANSEDHEWYVSLVNSLKDEEISIIQKWVYENYEGGT